MRSEIRALQERVFELESLVGPEPCLYEDEELQGLPLGESERGLLLPGPDGRLVLLRTKPKGAGLVLSANRKGTVAWRFLDVKAFSAYGYSIACGTIGEDDFRWEKV